MDDGTIKCTAGAPCAMFTQLHKKVSRLSQPQFTVFITLGKGTCVSY